MWRPSGRFFVLMDVIIKPEQKQVKDVINPNLLKDKPRQQVQYEAEKVVLSDNIQKFDKKPRVFTQNPYDYNSVSLHKNKDTYTPSAEQMIADPTYNLAGKALGVDTVHDWNRDYDKVAKIVDWAREQTGLTDSEKLSSWIYAQLRNAPAMGGKRIDDLYIYSRLKAPTKAPVRTVTKTVIKKVYVKREMSQEDMVSRLIRGI